MVAAKPFDSGTRKMGRISALTTGGTYSVKWMDGSGEEHLVTSNRIVGRNVLN